MNFWTGMGPYRALRADAESVRLADIDRIEFLDKRVPIRTLTAARDREAIGQVIEAFKKAELNMTIGKGGDHSDTIVVHFTPASGQRDIRVGTDFSRLEMLLGKRVEQAITPLLIGASASTPPQSAEPSPQG